MKQVIKQRLQPRRQPLQDRSIKRAQQIMDVTAKLLDRVGFDDLTTILIAKELNISVGSLYHYFPNKHAILYAIAENWLQDWDKVLDDISQLPVEDMKLESIVSSLSETFLTVYREQKGILPLVQAMYAVPELRDLDEQHDKLLALRISALFKRMGLLQNKKELERIACCYLEVTHAMLVTVLDEKGKAARRSLDDLNAMIVGLLSGYQITKPSQ